MLCRHLGGNGAAIGDRELGAGSRLAQPVGAVDDRRGEIRVDLPPRLVERPGRQPEIDRLALLALDLLEGPAQQDRQLVGIGGSKAVSPACATPVSRSPTDWCAPPSGAKVIPDGVATRRTAHPDSGQGSEHPAALDKGNRLPIGSRRVPKAVPPAAGTDCFR
jgi:hypothetical protein